jgi:alpha-beta hydrolase superfamily lysophospholipase
MVDRARRGGRSGEAWGESGGGAVGMPSDDAASRPRAPAVDHEQVAPAMALDGSPVVGATRSSMQLPVDHFGSTVHVSGWRRESTHDYPVLIVHDLGEHADLYRPAALALVAMGYAPYCFDLRGHGRSARPRVAAPTFGALTADLLQVAAWIRHKEGGRAPIVLGQGIGALVAVDFARLHAAFCRGIILSAPCLQLVDDVPTVTRLVLRALADVAPGLPLPRFLVPRFARELIAPRPQLEVAPPPDGASEAPEEAAAPEPGPPAWWRRFARFAPGRRGPTLTAAFAHELVAATRRGCASVFGYGGDVLVLCPEQDEVSTYAALRKALAVHSENNFELVELATAGHGLLTGMPATRDATLAKVREWLERVLAKPREPARPKTTREELRIVSAHDEDARPLARD